MKESISPDTYFIACSQITSCSVQSNTFNKILMLSNVELCISIVGEFIVCLGMTVEEEA